MRTPEARVKDAVRKWLKTIGAYRFGPTQMGYGTQTLDDLCCIFGLFFAIEYKASGKKPTPRQLLTMTAIEHAGGIAIWGDSFESIFIQIKERIKDAKPTQQMTLENGSWVRPG